MDLKSIPHPGEFSSRHPEHEHSPFNTHYSTPSPSQAPRNGYSMFSYQMPQTPRFSLDVPVLQPSLQIQTQQIDRLVPKLESPLTPIQPPTSLQNLNQRGQILHCHCHKHYKVVHRTTFTKDHESVPSILSKVKLLQKQQTRCLLKWSIGRKTL